MGDVFALAKEFVDLPPNQIDHLRRRGIKPRIARRQIESSIQLGRRRWKVEPVAVVAELLQAAAGAVGSGFGTLVRVRAGGLCGGVLQPALTVEGSDTTS
jgi:hypothetical protein